MFVVAAAAVPGGTMGESWGHTPNDGDDDDDHGDDYDDEDDIPTAATARHRSPLVRTAAVRSSVAAVKLQSSAAAAATSGVPWISQQSRSIPTSHHDPGPAAAGSSGRLSTENTMGTGIFFSHLHRLRCSRLVFDFVFFFSLSVGLYVCFMRCIYLQYNRIMRGG